MFEIGWVRETIIFVYYTGSVLSAEIMLMDDLNLSEISLGKIILPINYATHY